RRVASAQRSDRTDRSPGEPAVVRGGRYLGRHSASRRHAVIEDDRRDQQGQGSADLQSCRLRNRGRRTRGRTGAHRRGSRGQGRTLMSASSALFAFVLTLSVGFFALNVQRLVRYMNLGVSEDRTDHPFERLKNVLTIGIAQTKIFRDPIAGPMHALIFWGFV